MQTTLNKIREHSPCTGGWEKLLTYLGKTKADDEPLEITTILDSNGFNDALWCLIAVEGKDKEIRLYAVWCARQVQHLLKDKRSIDALDVAERYANGEATKDELDAAWEDAKSTDRYADRAATAAAEAPARATRAAMEGAWWAVDAAMAAAWADAWDDTAAMYAAKAKMRLRQEAELRRICEDGEVGHEATKTYYQKV